MKYLIATTDAADREHRSVLWFAELIFLVAIFDAQSLVRNAQAAVAAAAAQAIRVQTN